MTARSFVCNHGSVLIRRQLSPGLNWASSLQPQGRKLLRERGYSTVLHSTWEDHSSSKAKRSDTGGNTRKSAAISDKIRPRQGKVTIVGDALKCSLCRYALYDDSSLWLEMGNVALNYGEIFETSSFERTVQMLISSVRMSIKNRRLVEICKPVTLALVTEEDDRELRIDFSTQFESAVEVSSSLSQYKELTEIVRQFLGSGRDGEDQLPAGQPSDDLMAAANERGESSEALRIMHGRKLHGRKVVFGRIDFSPRLHALGDLTPNLDTVLGWLDLGSIETIPLAAYEYLALPTGKLLGATIKGAQPLPNEADSTSSG